MNCESIIDQIPAIAARRISGTEREIVIQHIDKCEDCRFALRGAEALLQLKGREVQRAPDALFEQVMARSREVKAPGRSRQPFWLGTAFGGAIAASLFAFAFFFGWAGNEDTGVGSTAEFIVAIGETRQMDLAFETDRPLDGATISIVLSGDIEIVGYGLQRELQWTENLDAGVNRLSLPVLASSISGGQMIVRMTHPLSEQTFVINMPVKS